MYRRFHTLVMEQIHTPEKATRNRPTVSQTAWALMGLATMSNIVLELNLLQPGQRKQMFSAVAELLVGGEVS